MFVLKLSILVKVSKNWNELTLGGVYLSLKSDK